MNQYYSAELSQKIKRGKRETRIKGLFPGGHVAYGYALDGRKLIVDKTSADIVRYIFLSYSQGANIRKIISDLASRGATYHGKPFTDKLLYHILRNEKYTGIYRYGEENENNIYPQIISAELYGKVRYIINKNKYGKRSVKTIYLLRGKLVCGYCGQPVYADCCSDKNGKIRYYYKCNGRKKKLNDCKKTGIRKEKLEALILDSIITQMNNPETMNKFIKEILDTQERQLKEHSGLNALLKEQRQNETALNNIMCAIEHGVINNTTGKRMKELEERQEELKRIILIEENKKAVVFSEEQARRFYEKALSAEPQMLINCLVKKIVLFDDRAEIYFNNSTITDPDKDRGFLFCVTLIHVL